MIKKVRIVIEGEKVQGVGYRIFLTQKALESGIDKILPRNIDKDKVEVLVEDDESKVNKFYETVKKERPVPSKMKREPYEDEIPVPTIDRYLSYLTAEQLVQGRQQIAELPDKVAEKLPLKDISNAILGIHHDFNQATKRFGEISTKLDGIQAEVCGKLDTLPERIADALEKSKKKS
ncbi:MAG: acylphosphatase [Candidatus Bathyarchaeia archaeon]|nr:acylphosphatase [Candidatus Bathyarchaeia archaeon]